MEGDENISKASAITLPHHRSDLKPWSAIKMRAFFSQAVANEQSWTEMSILSKILYITLDIPFDFLRRITMPPPADDMWYRPFACIWPTFMTLLFFIT